MQWLIWFIAVASTYIALLVVLATFLLTICGLLWLNGRLIIHILDELNALRIFASYIKNKKDFKQYLKDREYWEEERRKEKEQWWRAYSELVNNKGERK